MLTSLLASGHSFPRTHRGHDNKFPGMAITYALMQRWEEISENEPERVEFVLKANVKKINMDGQRATGVTYTVDGEEFTADGPVILATGGYAADWTETSLIKKHKPEIFDLPSTNGLHATGDGQKMLMAIGANGIDMDKIQVHPTGLVDPKEPDSQIKFLAAEAMRGEGGLLLNNKGQRFTDELEHRDYVSNKMFEEKEKGTWPIRLVMNSKACSNMDFHIRHYSGRGLMKKLTGKELAKEIGCSEDALKKTFEDYNKAADGKEKDKFNKKFFSNGPMEVGDTFHVALMHPVLHYTMGGIEINDKAQVLNNEKKPFSGLYICGELAGGVHGANRLGGSSLLGCVVWGRVAGDGASKYLFQKVLNEGSGSAVSRAGQISLHIDPSQPGKISVEWGTGVGASSSAQASTSQSSGQQAAKPADESKKTQKKQKAKFEIPDKEISLEEVAKHNKKEDLWVAVKGLVMDLTNWVDEHPGGPAALYSQMGKDATEEFEMLHDDEVIPKYAPHVVIGKVKGQEVTLEY